MRLMSIQEYRDQYFTTDSRPSRDTVRRWLEKGAIPGRKQGGIWYIDLELLEPDDDTHTRPRS